MQFRFVRCVASSLFLAGIAPVSAHAQCTSFALGPAPYAAGINPATSAIGDVNGDQLADIVVANTTDETCSILLGTSTGSFGAAVTYSAGRAPRSVELGDLDRDGDLDLVVCNYGMQDALGWHDYGVTVLWNDGAGTFPTSTFRALPVSEIKPSDLALGDLDLDGDLDVVVAAYGTGYQHSKVVSFVNDGVGQLTGVNVANTGYDPVAIALGDINGDGWLDTSTANYTSNSFTALRGVGDGSFVGWFGNSTTYPQEVALGDFDGDGNADAVVAYRYGVHVLRSTGSSFTWLTSLSAGLYPVAVEFADLDGDGALDVAACDSGGGNVFTWMGDGTGTFVLRDQITLGGTPLAIRAGDLGADFDADLVVSQWGSNSVTVLRNDCALGTYCVGKPNSLGCVPAMSASGVASVGGPDDFHVLCTNTLNNKLGFVFFGVAPLSTPFAGGTKCIHSPLLRTPAQNSSGNAGRPDCSGTFDYYATNAWFAAYGWGAGTQLFAQCWSRDPAHSDGTGVSLSNGLRFTIQP